MKLKKILVTILLGLMVCLCCQILYANPKTPKVVVSIAPFHAIVSGVMQGVAKPELIVKNAVCPHDYALRPSDVKLLQDANIIFWGGPSLESFLSKSLQTIQKSKSSTYKIIALDKTPGLLFLPLRSDTCCNAHQHSHEDEPHSKTRDMHFWLDPTNAQKIADHVATTLAENDPQHASIYFENAKKINHTLQKLDTDLKKQLQQVHNIPYIVLHDEFQYFEYRYHLHNIGAITINPETPPSAKRLRELQKMIQKNKVHCVFTEPKTSLKIPKMLISGTNARLGELDVLGKETSHGIQGYIDLLNNLSHAFTSCLKP